MLNRWMEGNGVTYLTRTSVGNNEFEVEFYISAFYGLSASFGLYDSQYTLVKELKVFFH